MRSVSITGAATTHFGAFAERSLRDLAVDAGQGALADAGCEPGHIEALYLGNFAGPSFTGQNHIAPWVADGLGLGNVPATRTEAACASSGAAFFQAWAAVAGGIYDTVLVVGVEHMTGQSTARTTDILASAGDETREVAAGATFPALFAMIAARYFHEFGATREHLAHVAVKNHANGALNPKAHMRKPISMEKALAGRMIAEPLTLYDCSLISDGAAAVVLSAARDGVRVRGVGQASDRLALDQKAEITTFPAVREAAAKAYSMAGIGAEDVDFAELHDCFTVAELIAAEDLGFFARGTAGPATEAGETARDGRLPVNASGGLKSKGHPVGATGVAQIVELADQIRGRCGERQLEKAAVGLAQNLGGSGASCVVTVLGA